mmetsp:Transcript_55537/g.176352  ORF Transcript_55537/g.176352 Transcript_55537/m.176352 type:complete len:163 (-) Transcript_55537:317-805(-)
MIYSPLEQFSIISLIPLHIGNVYFSVTNSTLFLFLVVGLFLTLLDLVLLNGGGRIIPTRWQSFIEMIYEFIVTLVDEQIGKVGKVYFPLIFTLFNFLLFSNLIGMIPYSFTVTSHMAVTFGLSISVFIGITIIGFQCHGLHFFSFFFTSWSAVSTRPFISYS